jgi:hypothetical protein
LQTIDCSKCIAIVTPQHREPTLQTAKSKLFDILYST